MSTTAHKVMARRFLEEVVNRCEVERLPEFLAPGYIAHHINLQGIEAARQHLLLFHHLYPDLEVTVDGQIGENDTVATWFTMKGTHQGEWNGIKPTYKKLVLSGVNIQKFQDGLIVEQWGAANSLEALLSLGIIQWRIDK